MATYLGLVNSVLRRMREKSVTTVMATPVSSVVAEFVNDAKRVVEDSFQWSHLSDYVFTTTVAGQYFYPLNDEVNAETGLQESFLTERARFRRDPETDKVLSFITFPHGKENQLREFAFDKSADQRAFDISAGTQNTPTYVGLATAGGAEEGKINKDLVLWPIPDTSGVIVKTYFTNPQNDLVNDSDVLLVPKDPVVQMAYLFSLYERGEELGEGLSLTKDKANAALADAVSYDARMQGYELDFTID